MRRCTSDGCGARGAIRLDWFEVGVIFLATPVCHHHPPRFNSVWAPSTGRLESSPWILSRTSRRTECAMLARLQTYSLLGISTLR